MSSCERPPRYLVLRALPLLLAGLGARHAFAQPASPPAPPVEVARAEIRVLAPRIRVPGTVISRHDARLAAEVDGTLSEVAEVGTTAERGAALARVDDEELKLLAAEYRGLAGREEARIVFLENETERLRKLAAENNAARSRLEETESNLNIARNDLLVAQARIGQVERSLRKAVIRAPFAGLVTERLHAPGERVAIGDPVVRLIDPRALEVLARAPIGSLRYLTEGDGIRILGQGGAGEGSVRTIVPYGENLSHMVELRVTVPPEHWLVGENVELEIPSAAPAELLAIPRDALLLRRDGTAVFRVGADLVAELVPIHAGIADGQMIAVSGPLAAGDLIVVRGAERLQPGQTVRLLNPEVTADGSGAAGADAY